MFFGVISNLTQFNARYFSRKFNFVDLKNSNYEFKYVKFLPTKNVPPLSLFFWLLFTIFKIFFIKRL